ncbi:MAG TPA: chaperonin GroEL, partial [Planctomycetota bacterium]|nr:chaperonin GroEL [Planctomycetota bacterium]
MPKQILFDIEARQAIRRGVEKVANAVRPTLGPRGRTVVIEKSWGAPTVTKDGASVAEEIELRDPFENMGAQLIREAAKKTSDDAGDGTTTSTVLAEALYLAAFKAVASGASSIAIARGLHVASQAVAEQVRASAEKIKASDRDRMVQIASVAANGDRAVGEMLADAFAKVGAEGAIAVEEGKGIKTEIKIVEGMQFDRGFLSPQFVTSQSSVEAVLERPLILIHEDKLSSVAKLVPLLEKVAAAKRSLLVIAEDVEGEALATLVVNKLRGVLNVCAVKAPGYGDRRRAMLEDIGVLTGAKPVFKDLGVELDRLPLTSLGTAKKVIADADATTILEGAGSKADIDARVAAIRREFEESDSEYDKEKLQERLSKLSGGVARIDVGAATETELKERKRRVEDALHSSRAALEEGVVAGGGVALLRAASALDGVKLEGDAAFAVDIVRRALQAPARQIALNAGQDPSLAVRRTMQGKGAFGFDAATGEFGDLKKAGVLDPAKVVTTALLNAVSVAAELITAEALVSELPDENAEKALGAA